MSFTEHFWSLIKQKENKAVELILDDCRIYDSADSEGTTLLHHAAADGNAELTQYLLGKASIIDPQDSNRDTPLFLAVENGHSTIIQILLSAGADTEITNCFGEDAMLFALNKRPIEEVLLPLFDAIKKKYSSEEIARRLIDYECELYLAAYSRDAEVIERLIKWGVPLVHSEPTDFHPLHVAVKFSDLATVKVLMEYEADVEALDYFDSTPISYLYQEKPDQHCENLEILNILLSKGASLTSRNQDGLFNVRFTLIYGSREVIRAVLGSNIDFTAKEGAFGVTLLHILALNRNVGVSDELKPYIGKFDINAVATNGFKPLDWAARGRNVGMLKFFLDHGCKVDAEALLCTYSNCIDSNEDPNLECLRHQCAELLLHHNVDPEAIFTTTNGRRMTVVDAAIENQRFDRIKLPLAQMAIREKQGATFQELTLAKINSHRPLKTHFKKCRRLLQRKVSGSVSVFELLTTDEKKMAKYLNNHELVVKLARIEHKRKLQSAYWYYCNSIKKRFAKVAVNKTLRHKTAELVREISKDRLGLRDVPTEIIIDYLRDQDLQRILIV